MDVYIVGRGPSLLTVTRDEFGPGRVIALNRAIDHVRKLNLPNPLYVSEKDGCIAHDSGGQWAHASKRCPGPCEEYGIATPREPETLLVSAAESPHCFPDYPRREVVDVAALGIPWYTPSAPMAVKLAISWGATRLHMFAHDAYLNGDTRTVVGDRMPDVSEIDDPKRIGYSEDGGYVLAGRLAATLGSDVEMIWRPA